MIKKIVSVLLFFAVLNLAAQSKTSVQQFIDDTKSVWPDLVVFDIEGQFAIAIDRNLIKDLNIRYEGIIEKASYIKIKYKDMKGINILSFYDQEKDVWQICFGSAPVPLWDSLYIYNLEKGEYSSPKLEYDDTSIMGPIKAIVIPGTKNIYFLRGGYPMSVHIRLKLEYNKNDYQEIGQDFYYIGNEANANSALNVIDFSLERNIGIVAKGSKIIVLGWRPDKEGIGIAYIKTTFGLIGCVKIETLENRESGAGMGVLIRNLDIFNAPYY